MGTQLKQSLSGNIHKIREFELEKVNLIDEFDILQIVGEGWFGKILLVEHKATDTEMVLKALPKPYTALKDFYREFHYGLHLGVHKNIITAYDVAFETAGFYVFSQEYAPLGDLTSNVSDIGIGELHTRRVAKQLAAALEHMHSRELVHRDVKLDNILVFKSDFSRIKLCDFGETRKVGSTVLRRNEWLPYAAPEILDVPTDGTYVTNTSHDVWQFGIVIFVCLTGCLPWQKAALDDPRYVRYLSWQSSNLPLKRQPKLFKLVSSKAQRFFKRYLEPKVERRPQNLSDVYRYLEDRLMSKGMEKTNETAKEEEGLCPSMYSFHSSPEEKNKLLFSLTQYGLETTVDRNAKKDRIRQWIQSSVIEEENEEEMEHELEENDNHNGPIGERVEERGPISESKVRTHHKRSSSRRERRMSTLPRENGVYKPPVDPRIPLENQKNIRANDKPTTINNSLENNGNTNQSTANYTNFESNDSINNSVSTLSSKETSISGNLNEKSQPNIESKNRLAGVTVSRNFSIYKALPFKKIQLPSVGSTETKLSPPKNLSNLASITDHTSAVVKKTVYNETKISPPKNVNPVISNTGSNKNNTTTGYKKISPPKNIPHTAPNVATNNNDNYSRFDELFNKSNSKTFPNGNATTNLKNFSPLPFKNVHVIDDSPQNSSGSSETSLVTHKINVQLPQSDIVAHNMRSSREVHRKVIRQKQ